MNECMESEIQELLPDVLHGTIAPGERARVEAHLSGCNRCREELEVLRAVQGAAVFSPSIDVESIVRQIPPYRIIPPIVERPVRAPVMRWLVAAAMALVVVGGGSVVMRDGDGAGQPLTAPAPRAHSLALASGLDEMSDGSIVQLMTEMNGFDALPANEPEPVFAVETSLAADGDSL